MPVPAGQRPFARAVAIGGGHGLSRTLQALSRIADHVTAVVTVADDGGSSGRLRRDLGVIPPGDLRMALAALCEDPMLEDLLQYRFDAGELDGHSLGNLVLVALTDLVGGDPAEGMRAAGRLLGIRGRVVPCTTTPVTLHAESAQGPIEGQVAVATSSKVRRVWLEPPDLVATPAAVEALGAADLIVLGPGSLYTSLIPNLLVPGIASAVSASAAPVVLVANLREQPGETEGMDLPGHLGALAEHVPGLRIDTLIAHDGPAPSGPAPPLVADDSALAPHVGCVLHADLLDGDDGHDPELLASAIHQAVGARTAAG